MMDPLIVSAVISQLMSDPLVRTLVTTVYLAVLLLVSVYGLHRYWLVWLYYRHGRQAADPQGRFDQLPKVTVQLPMFNESRVARRVIDAACRLEYPADKLQIQVLDDSTDNSAQIARDRVAHWAGKGVDIQLLHRSDRTGFKAGALAMALPHAKGQFIAIFDADFVPDPDFLRKTIHHFTNPKVGMVQTCWDHLNRGDSLLTQSQAVFLDGHFIIEHTARNRSRRWINFNGTAGIWRREAIESAGGWQHDTLTEDVDLSYRSQLAGWDFVFLPRVTCPAELPPEINAFKAQQHRWTKGSIQTAKKLLPRLLRADVSLRVKIEAFFHLTSPMVYLYVSLMALLFYPAIHMNLRSFDSGTMRGLILVMTLFALGTASAGAFYTASQRERGRGMMGTVVRLPVLMSIGIGIALNNARACLEALVGHDSPFVRTPKYNTSSCLSETNEDSPDVRPILATPSIKVWMSLIEIVMGGYMIQCAIASFQQHATLLSLPFLLLFAAGYWYVGLASLYGQWQVARLAQRPALAGAGS